MDHTEHQVRERAYYIWEGEGRVHGHADAHWLRAEAEFRIDTAPALAKSAKAPAKKAAKTTADAPSVKAVKAAETKPAAKPKASVAPAPKAAKPAKASKEAVTAGLAAKAKTARAAVALH